MTSPCLGRTLRGDLREAGCHLASPFSVMGFPSLVMGVQCTPLRCNHVNDTYQVVNDHSLAWTLSIDVPLLCAIALAVGGARSHHYWGSFYDDVACSPSLAPTWNPLLGQRVGEASHPGPRTPPNFCMNITVANITKLRKHKQAAISLWEEKQGILCLTETSADQRTERIMTKQVRQAGIAG